MGRIRHPTPPPPQRIPAPAPARRSARRGAAARRSRPPRRCAPSWNTRMRSARRTVDRRCAMMKVVRPRAAASMASCTSRSVTASSALVASSSSRIGGSFSSTRAMASRWRSPPDRERPRSPSTVASPSGWRATKSSARARRSADSTSSAEASGAPTRRFSSIERAKSIGSWNTTPMLRLSPARDRSRRSAPSIRMRPRAGSNTRCSSPRVVDLPEPVSPTSATVSPASTVKAMSDTASRRPS